MKTGNNLCLYIMYLILFLMYSMRVYMHNNQHEMFCDTPLIYFHFLAK